MEDGPVGAMVDTWERIVRDDLTSGLALGMVCPGEAGVWLGAAQWPSPMSEVATLES